MQLDQPRVEYNKNKSTKEEKMVIDHNKTLNPKLYNEIRREMRDAKRSGDMELYESAKAKMTPQMLESYRLERERFKGNFKDTEN